MSPSLFHTLISGDTSNKLQIRERPQIMFLSRKDKIFWYIHVKNPNTLPYNVITQRYQHTNTYHPDNSDEPSYKEQSKQDCIKHMETLSQKELKTAVTRAAKPQMQKHQSKL